MSAGPSVREVTLVFPRRMRCTAQPSGTPITCSARSPNRPRISNVPSALTSARSRRSGIDILPVLAEDGQRPGTVRWGAGCHRR